MWVLTERWRKGTKPPALFDPRGLKMIMLCEEEKP